MVGMYASNPVMSSDEAPDTGDDSDEDVITSYLMQHGNTSSSVNAAGLTTKSFFFVCLLFSDVASGTEARQENSCLFE